jgi:hypothetical protein
MRLDEEKLEALRSWGERLRQTSDEESVAVGRAIQLLVDEIDRLNIDLWNARLQREEELLVEDHPVPVEQEPESEPDSVPPALHMRLRRALRRGSDEAAARPVEPPESTEAEGTASAQAWLDSLRRQ